MARQLLAGVCRSISRLVNCCGQVTTSLLPLILSPVLGVLVIVALGMTVIRCRTRRRSKTILSIAHSNDSGTLREQKDSMIEETSRVTTVTLGRPITSYRASRTYTPEHLTTYISHAGESSQTSNGQLSDPFADSSDMVSSRTSIHPATIHSADSLSTSMAFTVSVNTDTRDIVEAPGSLIDASTSSLELQIVAPLVATDDSSTRSPYSPSWHYDGLSSTSPPPLEREHWDEEWQGGTSPVSPRTSSPGSPKPFCLGTESARLRLHALLEEARRI